MRTLLLADDSVTIQRVIALTFANEDFRVVSVSDGQQAIDRMTAQRPDIVLAGATMANRNGYDVSQFVRSQPGLTDVPVLLLIGAFEPIDEERLKSCGASGTIDKPFEPTNVISRVKELLGLKSAAKPTPPSGRLVTSADSPASKRSPLPQATTAKPPVRMATPPPVKPAPVTPSSAPTVPQPDHAPAPVNQSSASWAAVREEGGLDANTRSVEGSDHEPGRADYLDSLDSALDSLDARLSNRPGNERVTPGNPESLARGTEPAHPPSPARSPSAENPATPNTVFEVDEDWFAADDKSRAASLAQRQELAAEMGVHDVDLPEAQPGLHAAPAEGLDFDFGLDEVRPTEAAIDVREEMSGLMPPAATSAAPVAIGRSESLQPSVPLEGEPGKPALPVADAFVALLAHEQGEQTVPKTPAPVAASTPALEITEAMLDQIAARVADRLNNGRFAEHFRGVMAATVRDTVRSVVSETSEKLVRDEIARVKAQAERDTQ
jgi:CheY-like chemotaxis protein